MFSRILKRRKINHTHTMVGFWCTLLGFMFHLAEIGHDYKSSTAESFGRCFFDCSLDEKCQSTRFLWNTKECKLKKETKKSRPMDMEENPAATYMENPYRGIFTLHGLRGNK